MTLALRPTHISPRVVQKCDICIPDITDHIHDIMYLIFGASRIVEETV